MNRINQILYDKNYIIYLDRIDSYEKNRLFCKHNMEHFLDVARIFYIMSLENKLNYNKDIIYATALLHDIGRWVEYEVGTSHELASAELAKDILKDTSFSEEEQEVIIKTIAAHRGNFETKFEQLFYKSDKLSRNCFSCKVEKACNWNKDKKNLLISY